MTPAIPVSDKGRAAGPLRLPIVGAASAGPEKASASAATLPPAVRLSLSTETRTSSERLLIYGRPDRNPRAADAAPDGAETDPARMLDRKVAEARKEVAAIQIRQIKVATRDAGVLALLDPAGALGFAKNAAKSLSNATRTFGESEKTIRRTEDETVAETAPETVTVIAHDVYERTALLGTDAEARSGVEAAPRSSPERQAERPGEPDTGSPSRTRLTTSTRIEAVSVVQVQDDGNVAARAAEIGAARDTRMGQDAEVMKDAIAALRHLDRIIAVSTRKLQQTGGLDARTARDGAEARTAWHEAVADITVAALPIVQAGYSIEPDPEA